MSKDYQQSLPSSTQSAGGPSLCHLCYLTLPYSLCCKVSPCHHCLLNHTSMHCFDAPHPVAATPLCNSRPPTTIGPTPGTGTSNARSHCPLHLWSLPPPFCCGSPQL